MHINLQDKVAVVAGGSRGCGYATAEVLAKAGAAVLLTGRQASIVDTAVEKIESFGGQIKGMVTNMVSVEETQAIIEQAKQSFGDPSILVVNPPSPSLTKGFESVTDEEYMEAHNYYVMSLVRLIRQVLPAMKAQQWGRIVNLASIGVKVPHLHSPMYHQNTRVAVPAIMKTLSYEYARFNITANTLAPGPFASALADDYLKDNNLTPEDITGASPMGRFGVPVELANVVAFLCSEQASFVTGETIRVDGGASENLF